MMLFLLLCTDKPNGRDLRLATREIHLAYLAGQGDAVKLAGAWLDEADGGPLGSMLVVEAADLEAAHAFAAADPYALAGLFVSVEVRPWRRAIGAWS